MQYLSAWELHFRSQGWIKGQHLVLAKLDSIKKKTYINTLSPISLLVKLMLFACILTFLSKHIYSTPCTFVSVWHSLPPLYPNASSWTDAKTSCFFSSLFFPGKVWLVLQMCLLQYSQCSWELSNQKVRIFSQSHTLAFTRMTQLLLYCCIYSFF